MSYGTTDPWPRCRCSPRQQRGAVLFITLVVMILMTLAGIAAVRATDTGAVIAGNFAFKQAATQASDRAITDALNNLANISTGGSGNSNIANRYYSTRQTPLDSLGIPTAINWANVQCSDETGAAVNNCDTATGTYRVQYVIERQCGSDPTLNNPTDIKTKCDYEVRAPAAAGPPAVTEKIAVRYRVIIRARGPRDATGSMKSWSADRPSPFKEIIMLNQIRKYRGKALLAGLFWLALGAHGANTDIANIPMAVQNNVRRTSCS